MSSLDQEIAWYESNREDIESKYLDKWVIVHDEELIGAYDDFQVAAAEAVKRFGRGPFLLREVGAPPLSWPASALYNPVHADR